MPGWRPYNERATVAPPSQGAGRLSPPPTTASARSPTRRPSRSLPACFCSADDRAFGQSNVHSHLQAVCLSWFHSLWPYGSHPLWPHALQAMSLSKEQKKCQDASRSQEDISAAPADHLGRTSFPTGQPALPSLRPILRGLSRPATGRACAPKAAGAGGSPGRLLRDLGRHWSVGTRHRRRIVKQGALRANVLHRYDPT